MAHLRAVFRPGVLTVTGMVVLAFSVPANASESPDSVASTATGKTLYDRYCAPCHGIHGKGDGPEAGWLDPPPRDFTSGEFEFRSTESGSLPTDGDLIRTISNGLAGTSMAAWKPFIQGDSLLEVVRYVKSFSPRFGEEKPRPVQIGAAVPLSARSISNGERVYEKLQCAACHGTDGKGTGAFQHFFPSDQGAQLKAADLTEPWTFHGGPAARDIYLRFRTGLDGTGMPSYAGSATDREMWDLANYVVSISRKPVWEMNAEEVAVLCRTIDSKKKTDPATWGRCLVASLGCRDCHTPVSRDGSPMSALSLAGGQRFGVGPWGYIFSANLTSDSGTGLGALTDQRIKDALTKGIRPDGSRMLPFPMPWTAYSHMKPEDLDAVVAYLRTVAPIHNQIPTPEHLNVFSYLWGKFKVLILREDFPIRVYPGNAGDAPGNGSAGIGSDAAGKAPTASAGEVRP